MVEYVEHPVGLILEQLVLEDITVDSAPVEESDEQGNIDGYRLYSPGDLHITFKSIENVIAPTEHKSKNKIELNCFLYQQSPFHLIFL